MREDQLVIHEIYRSVQGESSFAGVPCVFVRTTGCNLRCTWCDTPQAFQGGTRMERSAVLSQVLALGVGLVEVTGGEPLLQAGVLPLMRELCDAGKTVLIETSGERSLAGIDPRVHRIMDIKAPGSGESHRTCWDNISLLTQRDEVKFVLRDEADYTWAREVVRSRELERRVAHVLFSPVHGTLAPERLIHWILRDQLAVRVNLQLHKYVWGQEAQGV